jgi:inhibitor of cysteine peptidase
MQQFSESSNGQEIQLQPGQEFEVRLGENPTTGFRWKLVADAAPACKALEDVYESPASGVHGQEGLHFWRFAAMQAGYGTIELVYRRSWESEEHAARRFTLEVRVKE